MAPKVLFVLTSHSELGSTGNKTGWYLPEVAHPYLVFKKAGLECDFVSPKGGPAPMDPGSEEAFKEDKECQIFLKDEGVMKEIKNTKTVDQVKASDYAVVFYAGGHGPMFDLSNNASISKVAAAVYENGGIVSAVCHGTVGLIPILLSNGEPLLKGQKVTSFSNSEEDAAQLSSVMPFMLETKLKEMGADYEATDNFAPKVIVSGRVITGQNPASANPLAEAVVKHLGQGQGQSQTAKK